MAPLTLDTVMSPAWKPGQRATLLFVQRNGHLLLIHKKRGLGAGKINGPGGRLEPGETPTEAAVRELREELGVEAIGVSPAGRLKFQFLDGLALDVTVFHARDCAGDPVETDEAVPLWTPIEGIPYDRMWPDDIHWLPRVLAHECFQGYFLFDGGALLAHRVEAADAATIAAVCAERMG